MLFNSLEFLIFLPIVFVLYWFVCRGRKAQNWLLLVASYIFYGWWDWRFLVLIGFTSLASYGSGLLIAGSASPRARTWYASANVAVNLGLLFIFKYFNFFIESAVSLLLALGLQPHIFSLRIILPVGISFYTFQALSYTLDVYKRKLEATRDVVSFMAYISFFPQLVAGPIERALNLLPQFTTPRHFCYPDAVDGLRQMLWGFFCKVVIADRCAPLVDKVWANYAYMDAPSLILGAVLFSVQIYCDFAGYSHIAIGTARLFGFQLMQNFNYPYLSRNIGEFWRRWHISLTTWFRDYLYIPLGGSRRGTRITIRNTFIIFLTSGFWHGANWTFIAWGLFHALLFLPLLLAKRNRKYTDTVGGNRGWPSLVELGQMLLTFVLASIGWIIFRAPTIGDALGYMVHMLRPSEQASWMGLSSSDPLILALIAGMAIISWFQRAKLHPLQLPHRGLFRYTAARFGLYYLLVYFILALSASNANFIYFQF